MLTLMTFHWLESKMQHSSVYHILHYQGAFARKNRWKRNMKPKVAISSLYNRTFGKTNKTQKSSRFFSLSTFNISVTCCFVHSVIGRSLTIYVVITRFPTGLECSSSQWRSRDRAAGSCQHRLIPSQDRKVWKYRSCRHPRSNTRIRHCFDNAVTLWKC